MGNADRASWTSSTAASFISPKPGILNGLLSIRSLDRVSGQYGMLLSAPPVVYGAREQRLPEGLSGNSDRLARGPDLHTDRVGRSRDRASWTAPGDFTQRHETLPVLESPSLTRRGACR